MAANTLTKKYFAFLASLALLLSLLSGSFYVDVSTVKGSSTECAGGETVTFNSATAGTFLLLDSAVDRISIKAWGAGGGGGGTDNTSGHGGNGGGGGYASGTITIDTSNRNLSVYVGGGGEGGEDGGSDGDGAGGGGFSGVFQDSTPLIMAGGGGGGAGADDASEHGGDGGPGGGLVGTDGVDGENAAPAEGNGGSGGTQSAGGIGGTGGSGTDGEAGETDGRYEGGDGASADATALGGINGGGNGGLTYGGGGGGGGYYGGGGGEAGSGEGGGGGGGGSSYIGSSLTSTTTLSGSGTTTPNTADPDYVGGAGVGGVYVLTGAKTGTDGGDGLVVVTCYDDFFNASPSGYTIIEGTVRFGGDLVVGGAVSKGSGTFVIDHPLDPANKLLYHSFVESPDVKNIYDGIVTLDEKGEATVELPAYFEALNRDYRYQVNSIGMAQPNLYVKHQVLNNTFVIAGGEAGALVSWQVTGNRQDPYILENPIIPEVEKGPDQLVDKGEYLFKDYEAWQE